jgi:hypothetical protein
MRKILFFGIICILSIFTIKAQNVGINSTGASPDASAGLDVSFTNKGLLIPRVALTATNAAGPITSPTTSLLVYNTATTSSGATAVTPGYYYWTGTEWNRVLDAASGKPWLLTGNAGTVAGTNFIGTTDAIDFVVRTNNTEKLRVQSDGNVGIGTTAPIHKVDVVGGNIRASGEIISTMTTGSGQFRAISGNYGAIFRNDGNDTYLPLITASGDQYGIWNTLRPLRINNATGDVYLVNGNIFRHSDGFVGIGTTTPAYKLHTIGDIYANGGWLRVSGNQGLYYESWGGGFFMSDGDWIRTYAPSDITGIDINGPLNVGGWNAPYRFNIGWYVGSEPLFAPTSNNYGYVGRYDGGGYYAIYEMNSYDYYNISTRNEKHDIYSVNDEELLTNIVMNDIDKIKPSFYRYNKDKNVFDGKDTKYKPQMHLGVIADESPDYILGGDYDKVNIYGIATLTLVGVKQNRKEIKEIKEYINSGKSRVIQDFGTVEMIGNEVWVNFSEEFKQELINSNVPIITLHQTTQVFNIV